MKPFARFSIICAAALTILSSTQAKEFAGGQISGRLNTWGLYETDDLSSATVAIVRDASNNILGVAIGPDIATACVAPRTCTYQKIGAAGYESQLTLDRTTDAGTTVENKIGGDLFLYNFGIDTKFEKQPWSARVNGNFTTSVMDNRALYGGQTLRPRFTDTYVQYEKGKIRGTAGRKSVVAGVLVDGITADYLFGPEQSRDSKTIGLFAGYAADPISKYPNLDYITFGPTFRFIPEFSGQSESKLLVESSLVSELFKGSFNRFYLYSKAHFTPVPTFSVLGLSTLDLPGVGSDDAGIKSTQFSLQTFWRPKPEWFSSIGFSQFRIERYLEQAAIQWVTDNATQQLRVSDSIDRSQRYRFDARFSYRPLPIVQPYIRLRYERRTFDSNKVFQNVPITATAPGTTNLSLFGRKDAYRGSAGVRFFILDDRLETETAATYNQRFQSKGYDFYQSFTWDPGSFWTADTYMQWVSSERRIANSDSTSVGIQSKATDYYLGIGGSYRFLSDFMGQIRYDFSNEEDLSLDRRTTIHTILARIDYSF